MAAGFGGVWFVWPALTQDFKAGFGIGISTDEEEALAKKTAESKKSKKETGGGVDYSATGALKTFPTRQGMKNGFDTDEIDQMPTNLDSQAVAAILAAKESDGGIHDGGNLASESVDALRTFKTRKGAKYEWETEEIDQTPGMRKDDEDDDDDEE